jgi:hypothetical protein
MMTIFIINTRKFKSYKSRVENGDINSADSKEVFVEEETINVLKTINVFFSRKDREECIQNRKNACIKSCFIANNIRSLLSSPKVTWVKLY